MEYRMKPNVTCPFEPILRFGFCKFLETVSNGFQRSLTVSNDFCSTVSVCPHAETTGKRGKLSRTAGNQWGTPGNRGKPQETPGNASFDFE